MFNKLKRRVNLLEKCDNYNTMYQEQADIRIKELEDGETKGTFIMSEMTKTIKDLEDNQRLLFEYLGVHKEDIGIQLIEDDCICKECYQDKCEEEFWEDVDPKYTAKQWIDMSEDWGEKFEKMKKVSPNKK